MLGLPCYVEVVTVTMRGPVLSVFRGSCPSLCILSSRVLLGLCCFFSSQLIEGNRCGML
jgi:hypothetical protein